MKIKKEQHEYGIYKEGKKVGFITKGGKGWNLYADPEAMRDMVDVYETLKEAKAAALEVWGC